MIRIAAKIHGDAVAMMRKADGEIRKAMLTAIKVEAFQLRKQASADIRQDKLHLPPITELQYKNGRKQRKKKKRAPLKTFSKWVRYKVNPSELKAHIGFILENPDARWRAQVIERYQRASRIYYDAGLIKKLHKRGIHIRKGTTSAVVPARDVVGAMMNITARDSGANITKNFHRKLKGERI